MIDRIHYYIFLFFLFLLRIPFSERFLSSLLSFIAYTFRVRHKVVKKNLEVFQQYQKKNNTPTDNLTTLIQKNYKNVSFGLLFLLKTYWLSLEKLKKYVSLDEKSKLLIDKTLKEKKGVIFLGMHYGNTLLIPPIMNSYFGSVYTFQYPAANIYVNKFAQQLFNKFGYKPIFHSKKSSFQMYKTLKRGNNLMIAADLNVPVRKLFLPFFGKEASFGIGPFKMALSQKLPVIFLWLEKESVYSHKIYAHQLYSPNEMEPLTHGGLAQRYITKMEKIIGNNPEHYFWFNKRWKTQKEPQARSFY